MELPYSTTNRGIFGEVQLKDGSECLAPEPGHHSPGAIVLGQIKSTTATLLVRKREKHQKTPSIEGPDYRHPAGLVSGGRILFRSDRVKRLPVYGYFYAS